MRWVVFVALACATIAVSGAQARGKLDWLEVANACNAKYGLQDGSGRASKAELDCVDYYNAHGRMPPTPDAAERYGDAHTNWIQTLCAGVGGRMASLNQAFQSYDSCMAWADAIGLTQDEAKRLSAIYRVNRL